MTVPDPSRRRFLRIFTVAACAAAAGLGWVMRPAPAGSPTGTTGAAAAPPTTSSSTTGMPEPTTTTSATTTEPEPTTTTEAETSTTAAPAAVMALIDRAGWGAAPATGEPTPHVINRLTVHHTAAFLASNAAAPAAIRSHQAFHQRDRGWIDLAYHFMIDAEGNVYEGRDAAAVGDTATTYDTTGHLLICCEGNFDEQPLPDAQRDALVAMLAWGAVEFAVSPRTIRGHRDLASTSCPGDDVYPLIASGELAEQVAGVVAAGGVRLERLDDAASAERVAAIENG